jgi:hypothetical protein
MARVFAFVQSAVLASPSELLDVLLCLLLDPYPFLNEMNLPVRVGFYALVSLLLVLLFHLVNRIHFGFDRLVGRSVGISKLQTERKIK